MMKPEFEGLIKSEISNEDYQKVETVYMWYPGIESKNQMAELYEIGMALLNDLLPRAKKIMDTEREVRELTNKLEELKK